MLILPAQFDELTGPITELYERYETSVLNDIARRLGNLSLASAGHQVQQLQMAGLVYEDILNRLSELTGQSKEVIQQTFSQAGVWVLQPDDVTPVGTKEMTRAMRDVLIASITRTENQLRNLTLTTASSGQELFMKASDLAYWQVSTGAMSYSEAIKAAVTDMVDQGLNVIHYDTGHRDLVDVATRRTVLTGVGQMAGELQIERARDLGTNLVLVSAHAGARNRGSGPANHESWQGKVYYFEEKGPKGKYPSLREVTGYETGPGLAGWNCRHSFSPFIEGISVNPYSEEELKAYRDERVTVGGVEMTSYEASQRQRYIERKIRHYKRQSSALTAAGQDPSLAEAKIKSWQAAMRSFVKETGFPRQSIREQIITRKVVLSPAPIPGPVQGVSPTAIEGLPAGVSLEPKVPTKPQLTINLSPDAFYRAGERAPTTTEIAKLESIINKLPPDVQKLRIPQEEIWLTVAEGRADAWANRITLDPKWFSDGMEEGIRHEYIHTIVVNNPLIYQNLVAKYKPPFMYQHTQGYGGDIWASMNEQFAMVMTAYDTNPELWARNVLWIERSLWDTSWDQARQQIKAVRDFLEELGLW